MMHGQTKIKTTVYSASSETRIITHCLRNAKLWMLEQVVHSYCALKR